VVLLFSAVHIVKILPVYFFSLEAQLNIRVLANIFGKKKNKALENNITGEN
jgi:hypothetical protein